YAGTRDPLAVGPDKAPALEIEPVQLPFFDEHHQVFPNAALLISGALQVHVDRPAAVGYLSQPLGRALDIIVASRPRPAAVVRKDSETEVGLRLVLLVQDGRRVMQYLCPGGAPAIQLQQKTDFPIEIRMRQAERRSHENRPSHQLNLSVFRVGQVAPMKL